MPLNYEYGYNGTRYCYHYEYRRPQPPPPPLPLPTPVKFNTQQNTDYLKGDNIQEWWDNSSTSEKVTVGGIFVVVGIVTIVICSFIVWFL